MYTTCVIFLSRECKNLKAHRHTNQSAAIERTFSVIKQIRITIILNKAHTHRDTPTNPQLTQFQMVEI